MLLKRIINCSVLFILILITFSSCQSAKLLPSGIQEGYEAVNPASIIAVPVFTLPDPSKSSSIDLAIVNAQQIIPKIQNKIIESFHAQPNINGYSYSAVSTAIGNVKPTVWDKLNDSMKLVANRFNSSETSVRTLIISSCLARKSFVEFYSYCLSPDPLWINNLNSLAAKVLNADTALLVVVTNIQSSVVDDVYGISGGFSVLLVDTNNGKLIWGKDALISLLNPEDKKYYPSWDELINKIFNHEFWEKFPGRIENIKKK